MSPLTELDCQACGACCKNPDANVAENSVRYVMIDDNRSRLLMKESLRKRHVAFDKDGTPWLRLDPSGRCSALEGRIGGRVRCVVYPHRPKGCRVVEAGSPECLKARKERGFA